MKIRERQTRMVAVDRELIGLLRLPTAGRRARGQNLKCDSCGEQIEDEYFLGGFVAPRPGTRNLLLHEACVSHADKDRWLQAQPQLTPDPDSVRREEVKPDGAQLTNGPIDPDDDGEDLP